jgi:hypothetical protein
MMEVCKKDAPNSYRTRRAYRENITHRLHCETSSREKQTWRAAEAGVSSFLIKLASHYPLYWYVHVTESYSDGNRVIYNTVA